MKDGPHIAGIAALIGDRARADRVEIVWPGGAREEFRDVAADRVVRIVEGRGVQ